MAAGPMFPEIELDAGVPVTTYHKVVFTLTSKQNGQPWAKQTNEYEHMSNGNVAFLTGAVVSLGGKLGPKGNAPKNDNFDLTVSLMVDGQEVLKPVPEWNGKSREWILVAEHGLAKMWMDMNEDSVKVNKAHGKID